MDRVFSHLRCRYLKEIRNNNQLYRIFFDEIHKLLTDFHYREAFAKSPILNLARTQIIGLSASIPPHLVPDLCSLTRNQWQVLRMPSNRTELAYEIRISPPNQVLPQLLEFVEEIVSGYKDQQRALIFCRSVSDAKMLGERLGVLHFASGEPEEAIKAFVAGKQKILPTTSALGVGFHYDQIRHVIHYKLGYSILDHYQEDSRGGRDGQHCLAITFMSENLVKTSSQSEYDIGEDSIQEWARRRDQCLRIIPSLFMDGAAVTCTTLTDAEFCMTCKLQLGQVAPTKPFMLPKVPVLKVTNSDALFDKPLKRTMPQEIVQNKRQKLSTDEDMLVDQSH